MSEQSDHFLHTPDDQSLVLRTHVKVERKTDSIELFSDLRMCAHYAHPHT